MSELAKGRMREGREFSFAARERRGEKRERNAGELEEAASVKKRANAKES